MLTKLDRLPKTLKCLICAGNQIQVLKDLPFGLGLFDCSNNPLRFVEPLPAKALQPGFGYPYPKNQKMFSEKLYINYFNNYIVHLANVETLLLCVHLGEEGDFPILESLEYHCAEAWASSWRAEDYFR